MVFFLLFRGRIWKAITLWGVLSFHRQTPDLQHEALLRELTVVRCNLAESALKCKVPWVLINASTLIYLHFFGGREGNLDLLISEPLLAPALR